MSDQKKSRDGDCAEVGAEHRGKWCVRFVKIQCSLTLGFRESWEAVRTFFENTMFLETWGRSREEFQQGEFHLLYLEPIQHIRIISDFFPSNRILVYEKLVTNPLQKDCLRRKIVNEFRVVMEV